MAAVHESHGQTVAVQEQDIVITLEQLGARCFFVEPTGALAGAALSQLLSTGTISPGDTTVVLLSGSGLKAALKVAELTGSVSASTAKEFHEVCSVTATVVEGLEASIFQSVDVFQPAWRPIPASS